MRIIKNAFTLIELLIVVAIITLLASVIFPAVNYLVNKSYFVKDSQQMSEIGKSILIWRSNIRREGLDVFPDKIMDLLDEDRGGPLSNPALFISVLDESQGKDPSMGRAELGDLSSIYETGCSYVYEMSVEENPYSRDYYSLEPGHPTFDLWNRHKKSDSHGGDVLTWRETKITQQRFGNLGNEFSKDQMPILRCFYHYDWKSQQEDQYIQKVLNVAWSTRVFQSSPFWEHDANPQIEIKNLESGSAD